MDASTPYIIVQLANGDVRTAMEWPGAHDCKVGARDLRHSKIANDHLSAGAKSVMFYCAPTPESQALKFHTLLFLRTQPGGKPRVEYSMLVRPEDCVSRVSPKSWYDNDRRTTICVRLPAWILRPRLWRLVGNKDSHAVRKRRLLRATVQFPVTCRSSPARRQRMPP
jgi:hypothetical protein